MPPTRRSLLGATAAAAGTALAGCSSVPLVGGGGTSPARDWLYDPRAFSDEPQLSFEFEAPAALDDDHDRLHPEVADGRPSPFYTDALDAATTDWAIRITHPLFETPNGLAYGGSFDEAAAREAASSALGGDGATDAAPFGDYETVTRGEEGYGAYREGRAISAGPATRAEFERLLEGADDGDERLAAVDDEVAAFLDGLGFDHVALGGVVPGDDGWVGRGTSYRIDGETTTLRLVLLNEDWTAEQFRRVGERIDGLRDRSVDAEGAVRTLSGVADTDRVGLRGNEFTLFELPYE